MGAGVGMSAGLSLHVRVPSARVCAHGRAGRAFTRGEGGVGGASVSRAPGAGGHVFRSGSGAVGSGSEGELSSGELSTADTGEAVGRRSGGRGRKESFVYVDMGKDELLRRLATFEDVTEATKSWGPRRPVHESGAEVGAPTFGAKIDAKGFARDSQRDKSEAVIKGRTNAREYAFTVLYESDLTGRAPHQILQQPHRDISLFDLTLDKSCRRYAAEVILGVQKSQLTLDARIKEFLEKPWSLLGPMDKAALRIALWELEQGDVPVKVCVSEAVNLLEKYGTKNRTRFVNGVLGLVIAKYYAKRAAEAREPTSRGAKQDRGADRATPPQ